MPNGDGGQQDLSYVLGLGSLFGGSAGFNWQALGQFPNTQQNMTEQELSIAQNFLSGRAQQAQYEQYLIDHGVPEDQIRRADILFGGQEFHLTLDDYDERYLRPVMRRLAQPRNRLTRDSGYAKAESGFSKWENKVLCEKT